PVHEKWSERTAALQFSDASIQAREIGTATALRQEPATRLECPEEAGEQAIVVVNPMEGGRAENPIGHGVQRERRHIGLKYLYARVELRFEIGTRSANHIFGKIAGENAAARQAFGELCRKSAGSAAGVENGFIALELHSFENLESPAELRIRNGVVGSGIPFFAICEHPRDDKRSRNSPLPANRPLWRVPEYRRDVLGHRQR